MKKTYRIQILSGLALAAILALAFFLRFYNIEQIPAGLYPDEAVNAMDAVAANESGDYKIFYPNNYGREGLFINLQAFALKLFGNTVTALKLWSILFGTLAVLGTYLLTKELLKRRVAALVAAFFLATSFWAINFSRIGFRAIMVSFLLSFGFYFFFRGLRRKSFVDFLISGLVFGTGLHTYIAFRITPLLVVVALVALALSYEGFLKHYYKHLAVFALGAFLAAAPLLSFLYLTNPEAASSRSASISIFSPEVNKGDFPGTLAKTFGLSLAKYNFWGDQNWRHNYPPYPILDPVVGTFFLAGFIYLIFQTISLLGRRLRHRDRDWRLVANVFLLGAFFVMLIPEFLTEEGLPHALRSIGTQVPVFIIAAVAVLWIIRKAERSQHGMRVALYSVIVFALATSALMNIAKYFIFFAHNPHQRSAFNENYTNMARYLLELPAETHKYVYANAGGTDIDNGQPVTAQPILFLTHGRIENLEFLKPETRIVAPAVILLMRYDEKIAERILSVAPGSRTETINLRGGEGGDFTAIVLPR